MNFYRLKSRLEVICVRYFHSSHCNSNSG